MVDPVANRIPPDRGLTRLVLQQGQNRVVTLLIDEPSERFPLGDKLASSFCALEMRIVNVLDDGFSRMQYVGVGHVVKKEQQVIGARGERFIQLLYSLWILSDVSRAGRHGAVHADSIMIGTWPLPPAISLRRLQRRIVMVADNIGERTCSHGAGVTLI